MQSAAILVVVDYVSLSLSMHIGETLRKSIPQGRSGHSPLHEANH